MLEKVGKSKNPEDVLAKDIEGVKAQIEKCKKEVDSYQADINRINEKIDSLKKKANDVIEDLNDEVNGKNLKIREKVDLINQTVSKQLEYQGVLKGYEAALEKLKEE